MKGFGTSSVKPQAKTMKSQPNGSAKGSGNLHVKNVGVSKPVLRPIVLGAGKGAKAIVGSASGAKGSGKVFSQGGGKNFKSFVKPIVPGAGKLNRPFRAIGAKGSGTNKSVIKPALKPRSSVGSKSFLSTVPQGNKAIVPIGMATNKGAFPIGMATNKGAVPVGGPKNRAAAPVGGPKNRVAVAVGWPKNRVVVPVGGAKNRVALPVGWPKNKVAVPVGGPRNKVAVPVGLSRAADPGVHKVVSKPVFRPRVLQPMKVAPQLFTRAPKTSIIGRGEIRKAPQPGARHILQKRQVQTVMPQFSRVKQPMKASGSRFFVQPQSKGGKVALGSQKFKGRVGVAF